MLEHGARIPIPCPPPGIYRGVPAATYHAWEAASNSTLTKLDRSPRHARHALDNPEAPTPATIRGDALHLATLEPHLFEERYVVAGQCVETTRTGSRAGERCQNPGKVLRGGAWRCGQHDKGESQDTRVVLSGDDWSACSGMRDAIRAHPAAANLLGATSDRELSVVFEWPGTFILCKARIDIPAFDAGVIGDLKTTLDASEAAFARSIVKYGYYRQAPFYQAACAAHEIVIDHSYFVAVEPDAPHGVGVYRLTDDAVAYGRAEVERLLLVWQRCSETGEWPGYAEHTTDISLPAWAYRQAYAY